MKFPDRITLGLAAIVAVYAFVETFNRHNLKSVLWIWVIAGAVLLSLAFRGQREEFNRKVNADAVKPEKYKLFG